MIAFFVVVFLLVFGLLCAGVGIVLGVDPVLFVFVYLMISGCHKFVIDFCPKVNTLSIGICCGICYICILYGS